MMRPGLHTRGVIRFAAKRKKVAIWFPVIILGLKSTKIVEQMLLVTLTNWYAITYIHTYILYSRRKVTKV